MFSKNRNRSHKVDVEGNADTKMPPSISSVFSKLLQPPNTVTLLSGLRLCSGYLFTHGFSQVNKEHHVYRKGERLRLLFETTELKLTMPLHHYNIKDCSVLEIQVSAQLSMEGEIKRKFSKRKGTVSLKFVRPLRL